VVKKIFIPLLMLGAIIFYTPIAWSGDKDENKGAKSLLIFGGKMRDVYFPNRRHQDALRVCNVCHDLFPKKLGSIQELKNQGVLEKKTDNPEALHRLPPKDEICRSEYGTHFMRKVPQRNRINYSVEWIQPIEFSFKIASMKISVSLKS
jgi:hypothetical protein